MTRPAHLPIRAAAPIVKASRELSSGQKLVWLELLELDGGGDQGAWLSAPGLAERVGLGREAVEQHRRDLGAYGILVTAKTHTRQACWYPTLPAGATPGTPRRPDVDEINRLARVLDEHIRGRRTGVAQYASGRQGIGVAQYASDAASNGVAQYASASLPAGPTPSEQLEREGGDKEGGESPASPASPTCLDDATASVSSLPPLPAGEAGAGDRLRSDAEIGEGGATTDHQAGLALVRAAIEAGSGPLVSALSALVDAPRAAA